MTFPQRGSGGGQWSDPHGAFEHHPDAATAARKWAVDVLGSPADPPALSVEAMEQLKKTGIPAWDMAAIESIKKMNDILRSIEDPPSRFPKSPLEPH